MKPVCIDINAACKNTEDSDNRHNNDDNNTDHDAADNLQCFFVCHQIDGYLCPPAFPNISALYSGAMT